MVTGWPKVNRIASFVALSLVFLECSFGGVSAAADDFARDESAYYMGDYDSAAKLLGSETLSNPKNAKAHYLLGNALMYLHRHSEASSEYESAADLDPHGPIGEYSRNALSHLKSHNTQAGQQADGDAS